MKSAHHDQLTGVILVLGGLGAFGALVWLLGTEAPRSMASWKVVMGLVLAASYGVIHGSWKLYDTRRRLRVAEQMRRVPTARVVTGRNHSA